MQNENVSASGVFIKLSVSAIHFLTLFLLSVNKIDTSAMAKQAYSVVTMIFLIKPLC